MALNIFKGIFSLNLEVPALALTFGLDVSLYWTYGSSKAKIGVFVLAGPGLGLGLYYIFGKT